MARKKRAPATSSPDPAPVEWFTAYKGFSADLTCLGFQYAIGGNYVGTTPVRCGAGGFHSCQNALDVWNYYPPTTSRYAEIEASGAIASDPESDTKIASTEITIRAELKLPDFIKRAAAWIIARAISNTATGDRGHAAATGYRGHAAATGYRGHAAATGGSGHAVATGDRGHAAATGDSGHAAATGEHAIAASLGPNGTAKAATDGWIVLAAWKWNEAAYELLTVRTAKVGGPEGIEADAAYRLNEQGEFVRAEIEQ